MPNAKLEAPSLSIVVPVLNEAQQMASLLQQLSLWRQRGAEIVLVDGGSSDGSVEMIAEAGFRVLHSPGGRAMQMNLGAQKTSGEILVFLHADTQLPNAADEMIVAALQEETGKVWGRFDVRIIGRSMVLPIVSAGMNMRSRLSGIATGDQAIFVTRQAFFAIGQYARQPLMEDVQLSADLMALSRPACLRSRVATSGRRWDQRGAWRTIILMWRLRWAYWRGASAKQLHRQYQ